MTETTKTPAKKTPAKKAPAKKKATKKKASQTRAQRAGSGRSYYLDGEWCKGVTSIIGDGVPKNGLIGWASNTVSDFVMNRLKVTRNEAGETRIVADELVDDLLDWNRTRERPTRVSTADVLPRADLGEILSNVRYRDLDAAARKGTEVHGYGERLARGEEVSPPEELTGHVEAYVRFLEEWRPTNAILEFVVVNRKWRYMGRGDLIADFPDAFWPEGTPWAGEPVGRGLLDIKTARSGIFADVVLQLQAYRFGEFYLGTETDDDGNLEEIPMPKIDFVAAVHVRADGYDVIGFKTTDDPKTDPAFRTFLYAKQVGDFLDWKKGPAATIKTDSLPIPERTTT